MRIIDGWVTSNVDRFIDVSGYWDELIGRGLQLMYKKIKRIFIIIFATFLLYGCSNNKTCGLLDIPYYKDLDISSIENIRVEWDVCESIPVIFYIDNDDDIKLILDELCSNET